MNMPTNGNSAGQQADEDSYVEGPLAASYRVQKWLEKAAEWFLAMGDVSKARALVPLVDGLSSDRQALLEGMVEAAEQAAAAAMVEGMRS